MSPGDRRIGREPDDAPLRMPLLQHDMWVWSQFPPYAYAHLVRSARFHGPLDLDALDRAFHAIIQRHEPLRTVFRHDAGVPYPVVCDVPEDVAMLWEQPKGKEGEELTRKLVQDVVVTPFELENGPLFRFLIVRESRVSHVVILCVNEMATDGTGMDVLVGDLDAAYRYETGSAAEPLGELEFRYRDVAAWERRVTTPEVYQERLAFWRQTLTGAPLSVPLPFTGRATADGSATSRLTVLLDAAAGARVRAACTEHRCTPSTFFLAVYGLLLRRYTGRTDIVVESPVANRNRTAMEPIVGLFAAGRPPLRLDLSETATFAELLDRTGRTVRDVMRNATVPFSPAGMARFSERPQGLTDVRARFRFRTPVAQVRLDRLRAQPYVLGDDQEQLAFWAEDLGESGYRLSLLFDPGLLTRDDARRLLSELTLMTQAAAADPMSAPAALANLPKTSSRPLAGPTVEVPGGTVADAVAAVAPEAVAVDGPDGLVTYGALDAEATRLAALLTASGIGPGSLVAVDLPPSADAVAAMLGVFRAGATCSLDPALAPHATVERGPGGALAVRRHAGGDAPASGAFVVASDAGAPVAVAHEAVVNAAQWQAVTYRLAATDRVAIEPGPGGAAWPLAVWGALSAGATVVVPAAGTSFPAWVAGSAATVVVAHHDPGPLPATLRLLLTDGGAPDDLPRGVDVVRLLRVPEAGGVVAFAKPVDPFRPIPNVTLAVVDATGLPVPSPAVGSLTVAVPGEAARDVGWSASIDARGVTPYGPRRADLDLHGFRLADRVPPLEAALAEHPDVADAAFGTAPGEWGDVLTAYVVPREGCVLDADDLERWLLKRDATFLPSRYVGVDEIPRPSRWVDRVALRDQGGRLIGPLPGAPPRTPTEELLVSVACEVAGRPAVGVHDDFFASVGDGECALRFVVKVRERGLDLSPGIVLGGRTIARMARAIEEQPDPA